MRENYLAKWLNNELSEQELAEFKQSAEYASYQKIAESASKLEAPDFHVERALTAFKERNLSKETKVIPLQPFKQFLRVAAAIAVLMTGAYFYLSAQDETFSAKMAQTTEVMLPDASEVILNAGSKVSFNERNWNDKRHVQLHGEAFFKVAKGKKFTVSTEGGTIAVLGTQFNVESRKDFFEVTCYEGLVGVTYNDKKLKLPAGSSFVVINGEIQETEKISIEVPSWTINESSFKSIPLKYVLAEFERQFDIEVETNGVDTEQLFNGSFDNTDLDLALESISTPSQIRFKLEVDKVLFYAENAP